MNKQPLVPNHMFRCFNVLVRELIPLVSSSDRSFSTRWCEFSELWLLYNPTLTKEVRSVIPTDAAAADAGNKTLRSQGDGVWLPDSTLFSLSLSVFFNTLHIFH